MRTVSLAATTVLLTAIAGAAFPVEAAFTSASEEELANARRFRETFGFEAGTQLIMTAASDRANYPNMDWGVPLTESEASEIERRVAVQLSLDEATAYARSSADFAGVYIDQARGGLPVFLFADDPSRHAAAIASQLEPGTNFDVQAAERSYADLEVLQASIEAERAPFARRGVVLVSVGILTPANKVIVGVDGLSAGTASLLIETFGSGIALRDQRFPQADVCTVASCWPPKGGIEVKSVATGNRCTSGFISKNEFGQIGLLTAGHCIWAGGQGTWRHAGQNIGTTTGYTFWNGADADAAFIYTNAAGANPPTKNLYLTETDVTRALTSVIETANQHVGDVICRSGITSGKDCGTIAAANVSNPSCVNTTCRTIDHTWEVNFDSTGGDSGGPYHVGITTGFGIHIHSDPDGTPNARGWYSPLGWVRTEFLSRFDVLWGQCLNAACSLSWPA